MGRLATLARQISWDWSSLMGDTHSRRYTEHLARRHPDAPVPTEREYWRMRHAATEANPQSRCC